jgi:hypothetical protein
MADDSGNFWDDWSLEGAWDYVTGSDGLISDVGDYFTDSKGNIDVGKVTGILGGVGSVAQTFGLLDGTSFDRNRPVGYQGKAEKKPFYRERVANTYDPDRRPGSSGQRYFSDVKYGSNDGLAAQALALEEANLANPARQMRPVGIETVAPQPQSTAFSTDYPTSAQDATLLQATAEEQAASAQSLADIQQEDANRLNPPKPESTAALAMGGIARSRRRGFSGGGISQLDKANAAFADMERKNAEMNEQGITGEFTANGRKQINFINQDAADAYTANEILKKLRKGEITLEEAEAFLNQHKGMARGGLASMTPKGYYLGGTTDGMADKVPATIDQQQPAALSDGEFVVPADVVSHLGNGNSNAGAKQLYGMMDRIRQARTGTTQQGKQVNPNKFMPV